MSRRAVRVARIDTTDTRPGAVKDKYGSDFDEEQGSDESTDSESAESEDEDGLELTPAVDAAILRTLAMIKRKHPSIYVPGKDVYNGAPRPRP